MSDQPRLRGRIYNMHGPTVYEGEIDKMLEQLIKLNHPHQNAGLYRLHVTIRGQSYFLVPYKEGER